MTFLPIVQRELRAAARRKSTHRIRWWTAAVAIGMSFVWLSSVPTFAGAAGAANPLFTVQTVCAFCLCLAAGIFLTSDSLSEEKREGTLGLLFLTDLKGYDVVVGKFTAMSLNAIYGLLTLLPVTAIPLLLGGVTLADYCRTALALVNALFFSLAAGIWVSVYMHQSSRAIGNTLVLLLVVAVGLPAVANLALRAGLSSGWPCLAWLSPACPFVFARRHAIGGLPMDFWKALLASHLLAWLFLALASRALPHRWQEERTPPGLRTALARLLDQSSTNNPAPQKVRTRSVGADPVLWLLGDAPVLRGLVWLIIAGWAIIVFSCWFLSNQAILAYVAKACAFVLKILVAFQACRFFGEARRNGAMELLLCTPVRDREIIGAQWRALRRLFLWPLVVFVVLYLASAAFSNATPFGPGLPPPRATPFALQPGCAGIFFLTFGLAADTLAVGWFGMWLALTLKRPNLAPALGILFVLILPSFFSWFDLVADMLFISWGTAKLQQDLRWLLVSPIQTDVGVETLKR